MSSALFTFEHIYTGVWTDYTRGRIGGLSLTLTAQQGIYIIAILALGKWRFVKFAGSQSWSLLRCAWFHARHRKQYTNGLFHQQQALLRREATDLSAALNFARVSWAWRKRSKHSLPRGLPFVVTGFLHFLAFAAAGIFSSKVVSPHSDVLMSGSTCGQFNYLNGSSSSQQAVFTEMAYFGQWMMKSWRAGEEFATNCYDFTSTLTDKKTSCLAPGKALIPWAVSNISCPFGDDICVGGQGISLDTGHINSHMHLGINSPPEDRVSLRVVLDCAPLVLEGYYENFTDANQSPPTDILQEYDSNLTALDHGYKGYLYGENVQWNMNYTFVYFGDVQFGSGMGVTNPYFQVYALNSNTTSAAVGFSPIPALKHTDGDTIAIFVMQNDIGYLGPSQDPVFGAMTPQVQLQAFNSSLVNETFYYNLNPVQPLACVMKRQWCNPAVSADNCTGWEGIEFSNSTMAPWNPVQQIVAARMNLAFDNVEFPEMIQNLGAEGLLATSNVGSGFGANPLPDNQWVLELSHWFASYLSAVQIVLAEYPTGTGDQQIDNYLQRPDKEDAWMCGAQIVQREDYYTFDMPGMLLILIGGSCLVIANLVTMYCLNRERHIDPESNSGHHKSAWKWYDQLQLQSEVYQAMGLGKWDPSSMVPVLDRDEEMFSVPVFRDIEPEFMRGAEAAKEAKEAGNQVYVTEMEESQSMSDVTRSGSECDITRKELQV